MTEAYANILYMRGKMFIASCLHLQMSHGYKSRSLRVFQFYSPIPAGMCEHIVCSLNALKEINLFPDMFFRDSIYSTHLSLFKCVLTSDPSQLKYCCMCRNESASDCRKSAVCLFVSAGSVRLT